MKLSLSALNRFRDKIKKTDSCWIWIGSLDSSGYGQLKVDGKAILAHRISYFLSKGDPKDSQVLHECDNPPCVNPEHLFLGTHEENMKDKCRKGRHVTVSGDISNFALYPQEKIDGIKAMKESGKTQQQVADEFGVSRPYVGQLWQGKKRNG